MRYATGDRYKSGLFVRPATAGKKRDRPAALFNLGGPVGKNTATPYGCNRNMQLKVHTHTIVHNLSLIGMQRVLTYVVILVEIQLHHYMYRIGTTPQADMITS